MVAFDIVSAMINVLKIRRWNLILGLRNQWNEDSMLAFDIGSASRKTIIHNSLSYVIFLPYEKFVVGKGIVKKN